MLILNNLLCVMLVVAVHEYGHFLCAKRCGITPTEFAIGLGPAVVSFLRKGTQYTLRAIPFGGYVSIPPELVDLLPVKQRVLVYSGGPLANLALCLLVAAVIAIVGPLPDFMLQDSWYVRLIIMVIGTVALYTFAVPLTIFVLAKLLMHPIAKMHDVSGPIGMISQPAVPADLHLSALGIVLLTIYSFSLAVGSFNLLPISILDGGRIFRAVFSRFKTFIKYWDWTTGISLAVLVLYLVGGDIFKLFN